VGQKRSSSELDISLHPVKERKYISQIKYVTATALIYSRASYEREKFCLSNYSVKFITTVFVSPAQNVRCCLCIVHIHSLHLWKSRLSFSFCFISGRFGV